MNLQFKQNKFGQRCGVNLIRISLAI